MEFPFNVNDLCKQPITKLTSSLIPAGFVPRDRREVRECQDKVADIINRMGEASARSQGLAKPITSVERLRNTEQTIYLLVDPEAANGKGCVTGLLKVGEKSLYLFDPAGVTHQVKTMCILDFYVHESRQRMGLGKLLFEHMLAAENVEPVRLAIDRPSEKFLSFLAKHYGLHNVIQQVNNFVVFDGFFVEDVKEEEFNNNSEARLERLVLRNGKHTNGLSGVQTPALGRYGARKPPCQMGEIIHSLPTAKTSSGARSSTPSRQSSIVSCFPIALNHKLERPRSLSISTNHDDDDRASVSRYSVREKCDNNNTSCVDAPAHELDDELLLDEELAKLHVKNDDLRSVSNSPHSRLSLETAPGDKSGASTPRSQARTPSNLTEQGFVDLKFYHSRLW